MCGQNTREERRNFSRPILCDSKLTSEIQREATIRLEGHEGAWLTGLRQKCRGGRLLRQMSCDLVVSTYRNLFFRWTTFLIGVPPHLTLLA